MTCLVCVAVQEIHEERNSVYMICYSNFWIFMFASWSVNVLDWISWATSACCIIQQLHYSALFNFNRYPAEETVLQQWADQLIIYDLQQWADQSVISCLSSTWQEEFLDVAERSKLKARVAGGNQPNLPKQSFWQSICSLLSKTTEASG